MQKGGLLGNISQFVPAMASWKFRYLGTLSNAQKKLQNIEKLKGNGPILSPQNLQRKII